MIKAIKDNNVPLSALWVYDYSEQDKEWNVSYDNNRKYMLQMITETNQD